MINTQLHLNQLQVQPGGAISIQQVPAAGAPAQLQYILPTVTLQTGPNGKVQNVLQMVLPGAMQPANIQLAIPGHQVQHPQQVQVQQTANQQVMRKIVICDLNVRSMQYLVTCL